MKPKPTDEVPGKYHYQNPSTQPIKAHVQHLKPDFIRHGECRRSKLEPR